MFPTTILNRNSNYFVIDEENKTAAVSVSEDQQSLAIGKGGQNVRLAAKLTGWRIDIQSVQGENIDTGETPEKIEGKTTPPATTLPEENV